MQESKFRFLGYRVTKIDCEIKDNYDFRNPKLSQSINVQQIYNENEKRFVEVVLDVQIESEDKTLAFFVRLKGGFRGDETISDEAFEKLSRQNAPAILYPFVRAIVTTYTAQANIPPVIMTAVDFSQL